MYLGDLYPSLSPVSAIRQFLPLVLPYPDHFLHQVY